MDFCEDNPCQHGGICFNGATSFTCQCVSVDGVQFGGPTCEDGQFSNKAVTSVMV